MNNKLFITLLLCCSCLLSNLAVAGSNASGERKFKAKQISQFAKKVENYAAQQGARVFIIARAGRNEQEMPKGINFTHTAIAVYSNITLTNGELVQGYAIHNLYQTAEDSSKSELVTDYPLDFFWSATQLKAGISIPSPDLQQRLLELIARGDNKLLHNKNYSVLANPNNSRYQNCTEYTLDLINSAIYQTTDSNKIKQNNKAYFTAQTINSSPFKLLLGNLFVKEVSTDDHKGKVKTATFTKIANYLAEYDLSYKNVIFTEDGNAVEF